MRLLAWIAIVALSVIGITFSCLNSSEVLFNYYFGKIYLPLSIVVLLGIILGILIASLSSAVKIWNLQIQNYRLNKKITGISVNKER